MSKLREVVFDIDDTAWALNKRVCDKLGININSLQCFSISKNDSISDKQKDAVMKMYASGETFNNIDWYDGFTTIFDLEQYNCRVSINSNCISQEVKDVKHHEIVDKLRFNDDRVILNVVGDPKNKHIGKDIFILVDDSPFNLAKSSAKYRIALRAPWNTSENAKEILGDIDIIYCDTFNEIKNTVISLLKGEDK